MRLRARRSFWGDSNIGTPRQVIPRGQVFETTDYHGSQLIQRGIAEQLQDLGPEETQEMQPPAQPQQPGPIETQNMPMIESKEDNPQLEAPDPLTGLTVPQLRAKAKADNIKGYSDMSKTKLINALKAAKGEKQNG